MVYYIVLVNGVDFKKYLIMSNFHRLSGSKLFLDTTLVCYTFWSTETYSTYQCEYNL